MDNNFLHIYGQLQIGDACAYYNIVTVFFKWRKNTFSRGGSWGDRAGGLITELRLES